MPHLSPVIRLLKVFAFSLCITSSVYLRGPRSETLLPVRCFCKGFLSSSALLWGVICHIPFGRGKKKMHLIQPRPLFLVKCRSTFCLEIPKSCTGCYRVRGTHIAEFVTTGMQICGCFSSVLLLLFSISSSNMC